MTVLTSEHQLVGTGMAPLPRVNLLPPEIAQAKAFRRVQMGLGVAVAASVVLVGGMYLMASHSVSSAKSDLAGVQSQQAALNGEIGRYSDVTAIYAAADAAKAQLGTAMGDEVRYSQILNDLSLTIPSNVWLTSINYSQSAPLPAGTAPAAANAAGPAQFGTASFVGVGFSHDDVASWLEAMAGIKAYANPYFSNSVETLIGTRPVVNFNGSVTVTEAAESHRYGGSVGG